MATASSSRPSSRPDAHILPDEPDSDDEPVDRTPEPEQKARRLSTSTTASRRQSYYDSQRTNKRSRPASWASQGTSRSKGKRASYYDPTDYEHGEAEAMPMPVRPKVTQTGQEGASKPTPGPTRNFSKRDAVRKRSTRFDEENLTETVAEQPVAGPEAASDETEGPYRSRTADDVLRDQPHDGPASRVLSELYTISYLIFFSILGTLARLGVQWLTFYPGAPIVTPVVWANMAGSILMGFLAEDQGLFHDRSYAEALTEKHQDSEHLEEIIRSESSKRKKAIPLYIGLTTGFSGCFTSFSSFMRDVFLALSNNLPTPINHAYPPGAAAALSPTSTIARHDGYSVEALLAILITTIALSLGGLILGAHLALSLTTPSIPVRLVRRFLNPAIVLLAWGSWLAAILLTIWPHDRHSPLPETWRGDALLALVFAPLGCLLRFYASARLNGLVATFPLGTFAVNMLGTAVEGMCFDIQHVGVGGGGLVGGSLVGCQVLQGVMDGFCGCLTTVSTWVLEINALERRHAYRYAAGSVLCGVCLMVVIMGSVRWTVGWSEVVCETGYTSKVHG